MAYDRADWHSGGDYPDDLPAENGGTHIGMFLAWAISRGLEGELHREESGDELAAVRARRMTGREFLFQVCDGKFWEDDLSEEGNAFAEAYYAPDIYFEDYEELLGAELPTMYHVEDGWAAFDKLAPRLDQRYATWKSSGKP
jgi:hypothetical protein